MRLATTDETTSPPAHAERLHEAIPGSLLEVLPDAEHWMPGHCAEAVASRIRVVPGRALGCRSATHLTLQTLAYFLRYFRSSSVSINSNAFSRTASSLSRSYSFRRPWRMS